MVFLAVDRALPDGGERAARSAMYARRVTVGSSVTPCCAMCSQRTDMVSAASNDATPLE